MCGRYYIDEQVTEKLWQSIGIEGPGFGAGAGDVCPSQPALVITGRGARPAAEQMRWGFLQYGRKGLLIHARAESVLERVSFRDSVLHRRCVIPAGHFYEWSRSKERAEFKRKNGEILYMAGLWQRFEDGNRFVILTTKANPSVSPVHDRMPLIVEETELERWIYDGHFAEYVLQKTPVLLERKQEYEQQVLQLW